MPDRDTRSPTAIDRRIGAAIRTRRLSLQMSQSDLGHAVGVTFQQIQKYENGSNRLSVGRAFELAAALGLPLDALLADREARGSCSGPAPEEMLAFILVLRRIEQPDMRRALLRMAEDLADISLQSV